MTEPNLKRDASKSMPGNIKAAAILTLLSGVFNVLSSALWSCGALGGVVNTSGVSLLLCLAFIPGVPIGVYGAWTGYRHLTAPPGVALRRPLLPVGLQIVGLLSCSMLSVCMSIVALSLLSTREAIEHYERPVDHG